ncbi:MAG: hypothetical protein D3916_12705 [Candidatus Electrothrix sp. MAN1_4]|nr:hypothetical protein [Candidatus Electrothrix sp. MAN1_4]
MDKLADVHNHSFPFLSNALFQLPFFHIFHKEQGTCLSNFSSLLISEKGEKSQKRLYTCRSIFSVP